MAGKKGMQGRVGRYKKNIEDLIGENKLRALTLVKRYLNDESIPLKDKIGPAMQIHMKVMPDKQEVVSLSVNLSNENASKLIELAERNLLIRHELAQAQLAKREPIEVKPAEE